MSAGPFNGFAVEAGQTWHVCCGPDWGPTPERGFPHPGPARFSPVRGADGEPVSVLYAGDTWQCALGETVFRDLIGRDAVSRRRLARAMLRVTTTEPVVLADLRSTAARASAGTVPDAFHDEWGGPPGTWSSDRYPTSQRLGQLVFDDRDAPAASGRWDGIVWNSHQDPAENAYLLFTDRTAPLIPDGPAEPLRTVWRDRVGEYATSLRVLLPIDW